jgi:hypothetical protein
MNLTNLRVNELKDMLRNMGLPVSGTKMELVHRINSNQYGGQKPNYFLPNANIPDNQQRYCRCILHVASKQPDWCLKSQAWKQIRGGKSCYNPYAICRSTVGATGDAECVKYYNLDNKYIPQNELTALELFKGKSIQDLKDYQLQQKGGKRKNKNNYLW